MNAPEPFAAKAAKAIKPRLCRCKCGVRFVPTRPLQTVATPDCARKLIELRKEQQAKRIAKAERAEIRARKEKIKTRRDWINEAQIAFNAFIRERDKYKPCICCGAILGTGGVGGSFDCGHYRSIGSAPHLRFAETNAHGQTKQCNRYGAGRAVDYRIGLVKRIGLQAVEALEADQEPRKWSIAELKAIRDEFRAKLKELKRHA